MLLPLCRHRDFEIHPRLRLLHTPFDHWKQGNDYANLIGGNHDERQLATGKILLMTKLLIRCHEYIELCFRSSKQFPVLDSGPPHFLNRMDGEMA